MNIIFLDVDGVLNSLPYFNLLKDEGKTSKGNDINDFNLQMLAKIYHACNSKIVLSSTWRQLEDCDEESCARMYQYLVDSLARYKMEIISKTPVIDNNRPLEIKTWLDEHREVKHFVILDDDYSKEKYDVYGLGDYLVHTKYFCFELSEGGLQQEHVDKAIGIFNERMDELFWECTQV